MLSFLVYLTLSYLYSVTLSLGTSQTICLHSPAVSLVCRFLADWLHPFVFCLQSRWVASPSRWHRSLLAPSQRQGSWWLSTHWWIHLRGLKLSSSTMVQQLQASGFQTEMDIWPTLSWDSTTSTVLALVWVARSISVKNSFHGSFVISIHE